MEEARIHRMKSKDLLLCTLNATSFLSYIYEWGTVKGSSFIKENLHSVTTDLHRYIENLNLLLKRLGVKDYKDKTSKILDFNSQDESIFTDLDLKLSRTKEYLELTDSDHDFISEPLDLSKLMA